MSIDYLKRCLHCDEIIAVSARRCPKCQSWQTRRGDTPREPSRWRYLVLILILLAYFGFVTRDLWKYLGADFEKYRDRIEVVGARMLFDDEHGERHLVTVGTLKNNSSRKWRDVVIEVQYFDGEGRLVGTESSRVRDLVLVPGTEHAFQVSGARMLPSQTYVSQKVFVRDAREATPWP